MTRDAAMAHLETYLVQVRRNLRGLSESEIREVLLELRSHVLDRVEGQMTPQNVETALSALGSPREVALANVTQRVAAIMERDRGFFGVLAAVVRLASLSVTGFVLFMVSLVGYTMAIGFVVLAVLKPFRPDRVGLWYASPDNYVLGAVAHPTSAHELMGYWIIPFSLICAVVVGWLTWLFGRFCVRLMARTGRRRSRARAGAAAAAV